MVIFFSVSNAICPVLMIRHTSRLEHGNRLAKHATYNGRIYSVFYLFGSDLTDILILFTAMIIGKKDQAK